MAVKLPNIGIRQGIYKASLIVAALATALGATGIIPLPIAGAIGTLAGAISTALADKAVNQQKNDGTLDVTGSTAEQAIQAINNTVQKAQEATSDLQKVRDAVSGAIRDVPVLGPLGSQIFDQIIK